MWSKNEKNFKASYYVLGSTVQKDLFQKHCGKFINRFIVIFTYEDNALPMFFQITECGEYVYCTWFLSLQQGN